MGKFTHINEKGKADMVDVGSKPISIRIAKATGFIKLNKTTLSLINENNIKKGDVLTVAEIAGIQAAKQTSLLIPLCHNITISKVAVTCVPERDGIRVNSYAKCVGQTGIEMEAFTAVNVALLTIYDMCKAVDKKMLMYDIRLVSKEKQNPENHE